MRHYWRVSGLDEGMPIAPYVTDTEYGQPYICSIEHYTDMSRDCEEISKSEYYNELREQAQKAGIKV